MTGRIVRSIPAIVALILAPAPAAAQEAWVGLLAHSVDTPFTYDIGERGADVQLGYRWDRQRALSAIGAPTPYAFVSINTAGDTSLVAAGLAWTIGRGRVFVRPGIGVAVHDGPSFRVGADGFRTDLGSRVLFEPELGVGLRLSPRWSAEAQWTHVSHARIFSRQNPGIDMIGVRLSRRIGPDAPADGAAR